MIWEKSLDADFAVSSASRRRGPLPPPEVVPPPPVPPGAVLCLDGSCLTPPFWFWPVFEFDDGGFRLVFPCWALKEQTHSTEVALAAPATMKKLTQLRM